MEFIVMLMDITNRYKEIYRIMCMDKIIRNCPFGIEYEWYKKQPHFKDVAHEKIECGCGSKYSLQQQHRHFGTNKHLIWLGKEQATIFL
jgi:hypothetical protein